MYVALTGRCFSASLTVSPRPPPLHVLLGGIYVVQLCSGGMEKSSGKELERGQKPKVRSLSMCCVCETWRRLSVGPILFLASLHE